MAAPISLGIVHVLRNVMFCVYFLRMCVGITLDYSTRWIGLPEALGRNVIEGGMWCRLRVTNKLDLMGVLLRGKRVAGMDALCDELLKIILKKLLLRDAIRAQAVCRRWRDRVKEEKSNFQFAKFQSFCPLVFKRIDDQHTWMGYHGATGKWEELRALSNVPRVIHLLPIPGSGNGLLGFKILSEFSGYIVGNPNSQKWTTLPRSTDCWGDAAMFMTSSGDQDGFRVVAVRDEDTHIYKSELDMWTKVGLTPAYVHEGQAVSRLKTKVSVAVCNDRLYVASADGNVLISFDIPTEKWTDDRIDIRVSPSAKKSMQLLECAGNLFAVTEDEGRPDEERVVVWVLRGKQFSRTATMPVEIQGHLKPQATNTGSRQRRGNALKLRAAGHGHQLFFWRQKSFCIVAYDLFTHEWFQLPMIDRPIIVAHGGADDGPQVTIDAGFFEPSNISDG